MKILDHLYGIPFFPQKYEIIHRPAVYNEHDESNEIVYNSISAHTKTVLKRKTRLYKYVARNVVVSFNWKRFNLYNEYFYPHKAIPVFRTSVEAYFRKCFFPSQWLHDVHCFSDLPAAVSRELFSGDITHVEIDEQTFLCPRKIIGPWNFAYYMNTIMRK